MPASFCLPETSAGQARGPAELAFLKSGFGGQLPQPFLTGANGTSALRDGFNDANREERDRYVPLASCDYVVDLELPTPRETQEWRYEPYFGRPTRLLDDGNEDEGGCTLHWDTIWSAPFLHAESTPRLARAFYIPSWSNSAAVFGSYKVLRRASARCPDM